SASVYDNQVSVPLARLSAQRVTSLYTLMDAAYDSEPLRQLERELGHVPIVAGSCQGSRRLKNNGPMRVCASKAGAQGANSPKYMALDAPQPRKPLNPFASS
ncbi:MAG: hypothetical protein H7Z77_04210, partial [Chitinophagaceae bacterium]|nr:hypothetical protein [Polaromonas sp.]